MNRNLARLGVITAATAALAVAGTTQASAVGYSVSATNANGTVKAVASFNNVTDRFCVNLQDGAVASAYLAGSRVQDFTANNDAVCKDVIPITNDVAYALDIRWQGTGGQFTGNTTRVLG